jgi:hypothetical protein
MNICLYIFTLLSRISLPIIAREKEENLI